MKPIATTAAATVRARGGRGVRKKPLHEEQVLKESSVLNTAPREASQDSLIQERQQVNLKKTEAVFDFIGSDTDSPKAAQRGKTKSARGRGRGSKVQRKRIETETKRAFTIGEEDGYGLSEVQAGFMHVLSDTSNTCTPVTNTTPRHAESGRNPGTGVVHILKENTPTFDLLPVTDETLKTHNHKYRSPIGATRHAYKPYTKPAYLNSPAQRILTPKKSILPPQRVEIAKTSVPGAQRIETPTKMPSPAVRVIKEKVPNPQASRILAAQNSAQAVRTKHGVCVQRGVGLEPKRFQYDVEGAITRLTRSKARTEGRRDSDSDESDENRSINISMDIPEQDTSVGGLQGNSLNEEDSPMFERNKDPSESLVRVEKVQMLSPVTEIDFQMNLKNESTCKTDTMSAEWDEDIEMARAASDDEIYTAPSAPLKGTSLRISLCLDFLDQCNAVANFDLIFNNL